MLWTPGLPNVLPGKQGRAEFHRTAELHCRQQYLEGTEDTTQGGKVPPATPNQLSWAGELSTA